MFRHLLLLLSDKCNHMVAKVQINLRVEKRDCLLHRGNPDRCVHKELSTNHGQICKRGDKVDYS